MIQGLVPVLISDTDNDETREKEHGGWRTVPCNELGDCFVEPDKRCLARQVVVVVFEERREVEVGLVG